MLKRNGCVSVITESTTKSRNTIRRFRKNLYETMDWDAVNKNNKKRILENRRKNGKIL